MNADPHERTPQPRHNEKTGFSLLVSSLFLAAFPVAAFAQNGQSNLDPATVPSYGVITTVLILACIGLNGFFVAADTALELLRTVHARSFEKDSLEHHRILDLLEDRLRYIAACTLGSQTMRAWSMILCFVPAPWIAIRLFGTTTSWIQILVTAIVLSLPVAALNMIFGELLPRSLAGTRPARVATKTYRLVKAFSILFAVPNQILTGVANLFSKRFGVSASFAVQRQAEEEIKSLVESAQETGEIEAQERQLINSVFEFGDTVAREVMTPRVDLDAALISSSPQEIMQLIQETGHSRIPLYEDSDDQIVGIIHAKDLLGAFASDPSSVKLRSILRPAYFVPENKSLHTLLRELQQHRTQMAIVQDEFGGTAGVVTIEDIVEELFGDIVDEYDREEAKIQENGTGWFVEGRVNLYELNQAIGSELSSDEFDTLGGYVFGLFGRKPDEGEVIEDGDYRFRVEETNGRRIVKVHVEKSEHDSLFDQVLG